MDVLKNRKLVAGGIKLIFGFKCQQFDCFSKMQVFSQSDVNFVIEHVLEFHVLADDYLS